MDPNLITKAKRIDLLSLAKQYTFLKRVASSGGGEWAGPCPITNCRCKTDGFRVQPNYFSGGRWLCRNCTRGKWRDAIDLFMMIHNVSFPNAVNELAGLCHRCSGMVSKNMKSEVKSHSNPSNPPNIKWQERAKTIAERAHETLWGERGREKISWNSIDPETGKTLIRTMSPLQWLEERGLSRESIQKYKIGFIPMNVRDSSKQWGLEGKPVFLPMGITTPCIVGENIWYFKIRRPTGKPKYIQARGGKSALFNANNLAKFDSIVFCEGELDAILLAQEVGDCVGVATLGGATNRLNIMPWGFYLLQAKRFFIVYDLDGKSDRGADDLLWLRSSRCIDVPCIHPLDKDITDYYKSGGNLRAWLLSAMGKNEGAYIDERKESK